MGYEVYAGFMEHGSTNGCRTCITISLASYKFGSADVGIYSQDTFIRSIDIDTQRDSQSFIIKESWICTTTSSKCE